jgi:hypothetical protein
MQTNDAVFAKEFRDMMNGRRSMAHSFKIMDLPLPRLDTMINGIPKGRIALVKGVTEMFFDRLNEQEVQLVGRTTLKKRQVLSDGSFRRDSSGNYVYDQIPVSHDCVAVVSKISIGLRRFVDGREHKPSEGFKYVDYVDTSFGRKYIYILPRKHVYRLNMCALILTPNKRRVYFKGCKLALQNGNYVYLYVIPYTYRENLDVRVLGVKSSYNFDKEVTAILNYWVEQGVIFHPSLTALESQVNGQTNLGIIDLEGTIIYDEYRRYGVSMAEEREEEFME